MTSNAGRGPALEPTAPGGSELSCHVVQRLTYAAACSDTALIAEVAALADGGAALVDPLAGVIYGTPHTVRAEAVHAAAHPQAHPHLVVHHVPHATLVVSPGRATPAPSVALIAQTAISLLTVQARLVEETYEAERGSHTAALELLLRGQHHLAADVLGGITTTHATLYRFTGSAVYEAHKSLWHAARPRRRADDGRFLVCLHRAELVLVALHDEHDHPSSVLSLATRAAERHHLTGGVADPVPLDMVATAWTDAGTARASNATGHIAFAGLGPQGLLRIVPARKLTTWSAAVLQPLNRQQRRTLETWLRSGSVQTAARTLALSEGTIRSRLRSIRTLLAVDLDCPTVQAQLLLALRAPTSGDRVAPHHPVRLLPDPPIPLDLLSPGEGARWASGIASPLDRRTRITLRCWLQHRARTAPAAAELGLHRTTLTEWLGRCSDQLGLDLTSPTVRSELHLAIETIATADDVPSALPRRGGRTYRSARD